MFGAQKSAFFTHTIPRRPLLSSSLLLLGCRGEIKGIISAMLSAMTALTFAMTAGILSAIVVKADTSMLVTTAGTSGSTGMISTGIVGTSIATAGASNL